jgi:hypothetical protein
LQLCQYQNVLSAYCTSVTKFLFSSASAYYKNVFALEKVQLSSFQIIPSTHRALKDFLSNSICFIGKRQLPDFLRAAHELGSITTTFKIALQCCSNKYSKPQMLVPVSFCFRRKNYRKRCIFLDISIIILFYNLITVSNHQFFFSVVSIVFAFFAKREK